jgi:5,10-methylenetetrahydromethanopterin reductase
MTMPKISLGFPPGPLALEAADLAEELGYHRLWLYDSASIWEDIWVTMGLVAERTSRIGLGTAVLIPNLRHVMTTASAITTIERMSPGRLVVGFGTGFTGRCVLGQKSLSWAFTERYVRQLKALLAGEVVEIDGKPCQMIHHPAMAKARPIPTPIVLSAFGPKGQAIAKEIADGIMCYSEGANDGTWDQFIRMVDGTVLEPGESPHSERAIDAAGPWWVMRAHATLEMEGVEALGKWPGGDEYLDRVAADRLEGQRHLAIHEGHCTHLTERDRILIDAVGGKPQWRGWVGEPAEIKRRAEEEAAAGVSEVFFVPAGSDPLREVRAFAEATIG